MTLPGQFKSATMKILPCRLAGLLLVLVLSCGLLVPASAKPLLSKSAKTGVYLLQPNRVAPLAESVWRNTPDTSGDSWLGNLKSITCSVCKVVVGFLQTALSLGWTDEKIAKAATKLCIGLGEVDERVCVGLIKMFKVSDIM